MTWARSSFASYDLNVPFQGLSSVPVKFELFDSFDEQVNQSFENLLEVY
jgi:hypothetical protein